MRRLLFTSICIITYLASSAQNTWSNNVGEIMFNHCSRCHHEGGLGPFPIMSYQNAFDFRYEIEAAVSEGHMPPWPADPEYRHFAFENVLNDEERSAILDWISADAPHGNEAEDPEPPTFQVGSQLSSIDLTSQIPVYTSNASDEDVYRSFVVPSGLTEDVFVDMMEVIPGNTAIVHHVLVYYDPTSTSADMDAADPGPGFTSFGTAMNNEEAVLLGGWVPGSEYMQLPDGFGALIEAGSDIVIEVHYPAGSDGQTDETLVNFHFSDAGFVRPVYMSPTLYHFPPVLQEPFLYIPADQTATFHEEYTVPLAITAFSVLPHMHLIGKSIICWGETPDDQTIPIVSIPEWEFHWQMSYRFPQLQLIPAGTVMKAEAFYDNTENNEENPNTPPEDVWVGEETTDEMMIIFFSYTIYFPGDEDIVVDPALNIAETPTSKGAFNVFPNPANDYITINSAVPARTSADIEIYNQTGQLVLTENQSLKAGLDRFTMDISDLKPGMYVVKMIGKDLNTEHKLVIE